MFSDYIEREFDDQLRTWLDVLALSVRAEAEGRPSPPQMSDPRFEKPMSGWYWQIAYPEEPIVRSRSLAEATLPTVETPLRSDVVHTTIEGPAGRSLRLVERQVRLGNDAVVAHIAVAGPLADAAEDIQ